jgi:hypothetical protein
VALGGRSTHFCPKCQAPPPPPPQPRLPDRGDARRR